MKFSGIAVLGVGGGAVKKKDVEEGDVAMDGGVEEAKDELVSYWVLLPPPTPPVAL